jgi:hypothetical protein
MGISMTSGIELGEVSWAVSTAATQTKPAYAGFRSLDFPLVRAGGLGFYSRDF